MNIIEKHNLKPIDSLAKLNTKRLLAYYKKHRGFRHYGKCSCCSEIINAADKPLNEELNQYFDNIKIMLDSREHII